VVGDDDETTEGAEDGLMEGKPVELVDE